VTVNGKRCQLGKSGFESARAAADARAELQRRYRQGSLPEDMKMTVEPYLRQWLAGKIQRKEVGESATVGYRQHIERDPDPAARPHPASGTPWPPPH
jgi:hypothetical protein